VNKISTFAQDLKAAGVTQHVKLVPVPRSRGHLMLRIENIADLESGVDAQVDVYEVARAYWKEANGDSPLQVVDITELTLTGNQEIDEMRAKKIKWSTRDDETILKNSKQLSYSFVEGEASKLEPQRIRVFDLKFMEADKFLY